MAEGASNKMIARALGISVHTAKFHVGSVIDKLDATGRTDAVAHAARPAARAPLQTAWHIILGVVGICRKSGPEPLPPAHQMS